MLKCAGTFVEILSNNFLRPDFSANPLKITLLFYLGHIFLQIPLKNPFLLNKKWDFKLGFKSGKSGICRKIWPK